jgi:F-type H+-transporting ATPase subunit b
MNVVALMVQSGGAQAQSIASTFGVDWPHLGAQIISFSIVCALLYKLAYQPVLNVLAQRRQQIELGIANTEKINAALADVEARRKEVLTRAQREATEIVANAREVARRLNEQETQRAGAAAEQIVVRARDAATQEHSRMLAELRREVGRLVVQTTAAVTGKVLTTDDQRRLNEETARQLAS